MQEHHSASPTVTRIVTVLGIASLIGMAAFGVFFWWIGMPSVEWNLELFSFKSGPHCYVFREPKLAVFIGDGGDEEIFDRVYSEGYIRFTANPERDSSKNIRNGVELLSFEGRDGEKTMRFFEGKCVMHLSHRGRKLTLADGREFTLGGRTPLWLRCKSDGTIVELEKLPEGFVEFFESPPPDPGLIDSVKSWPEAFRK